MKDNSLIIGMLAKLGVRYETRTVSMMNNLVAVSKRSSFMMEDILLGTHARSQDETLTYECSSNLYENSEATCVEDLIEFEVPSKAKATRAYPTTQQREYLLAAFVIQPYPSKEQMNQLADCLGFKFEKVRRWFENRRKTEKRRHAKKLRELDELASSLSSSRQPISQAQCLRSQGCTPVSVPYPNTTTCRNYGLVQRSSIRSMPMYRRTVQTSRVEPESKQMVTAYKLAHAPQPLTQMNAFPSSLLQLAYSCKAPVLYRFQV